MDKVVSSTLNRISWIDICRGIAILFVMYAHALPSDSYRYMFYAFHMPLFFFLSGIVFKENFPSYWSFVKKSFKTIMLPYFLFAVLTYFFWFLKEHTTHNTMHDFLQQIYGIFYGNGNGGYLYFNVALWFLPCLFLARIGFAAITRISTQMRFLLPVLFGLSIIGYVLSTYYSFLKLPFGMETAFTAIVFFGLGFLLKKKEQIFQFVQKYNIAVFFIGLIVLMSLAFLNYQQFGAQIDLRVNRLNNYFLFYFAAMAGIFCWIAFSMILKRNNILEYIGQRTMILFVWHYLLYSYFTDFMNHYFSKQTIQDVKMLKPAVFTLLALGIILGVREVIKKFKNPIYLSSRP